MFLFSIAVLVVNLSPLFIPPQTPPSPFPPFQSPKSFPIVARSYCVSLQEPAEPNDLFWDNLMFIAVRYLFDSKEVAGWEKVSGEEEDGEG